MVDTKSRVALIRWIEKDPRRRTHRFINKSLGLNARSNVRKWLLGLTRPEAHMRLALEYLTDGEVEASGWMTDAERALVERLRTEHARGPTIVHASTRTHREAAGM